MSTTIIRRRLIPAVLFSVILSSLHIQPNASAASLLPASGGRESAPSVYAAESSLSLVSSASQEEEVQLKLNAQSAVLIDAETGRVLYGKNEKAVRPMASTTKIMTCILVLENGNPEDEIVVSSYAAGQPKVHLGAPAGRRFRVGDLLYSLMLESHNDSAVMLAEYVAGDVKTFANMMNQKAGELGCEDTWFITPNGLDAKETAEGGEEKIHSTTARDLAVIMSYCAWKSPKSKEFLEITGTQNYYFTDLDGKGSYSCVNHNAFLNMMDGVLSGKTGFTGRAGYSYVAAMEEGGRRYVVALLGCGWPPHKTYKWTDARTLYRYGLEEYHKEELKRPGRLEGIPVKGGIPEDGSIDGQAVLELTAGQGERGEALVKEGEQVEVTAALPEYVAAPVERGQTVGKLIYSLGDTTICTEPVYAAEDVKAIDYQWCVRRVVEMFYCHGR